MERLAEKISDSELEIMRTLWEAGSALPVAEIRQRLQQRLPWENTTVKTLVQRLHSKGVLEQEKRDVYYYTPLISAREYGEYATGNLIRKLYQGSARNLVAAMVRSHGLSQEDIAELQSMFEVRDDE